MFTSHSLRRGWQRCLAGVAALALAGSMATSPAQAATSGSGLRERAADRHRRFHRLLQPVHVLLPRADEHLPVHVREPRGQRRQGRFDHRGLATEWNTDSEGKVWTYTIRPDMKWSDGEPLTSKDVAWTYNQMMEKEEMAVANGSLVENFDKVEAPTTAPSRSP